MSSAYQITFNPVWQFTSDSCLHCGLFRPFQWWRVEPRVKNAIVNGLYTVCYIRESSAKFSSRFYWCVVTLITNSYSQKGNWGQNATNMSAEKQQQQTGEPKRLWFNGYLEYADIDIVVLGRVYFVVDTWQIFVVWRGRWDELGEKGM